MTINLIPREIKLRIKGRDWTPWLFEFKIGWEEISLERGVAKVSGTITLKLGKSGQFPTDPDTRVNRSEWDRGTLVTITVDGKFLPCAGNALYILKLPPRPWGIEKRLILEVGDILTLRSFAEPNPEEELTGVTLNGPLSRNQVIVNVLTKAGIKNHNIQGYTDSIVYPYQKQSGSLVDFAGQISAADSAILFSNNSSVVSRRLAGILNSSRRPFPVYDYVELMPTSEYTPIAFEELYVRSILYKLQDSEQKLGDSFTSFTEETTIELPKGVVFPIIPGGLLSVDLLENKKLITAEKTTVSYSSTTSKDRKDREDKIETTIKRPKGVVFPIIPGGLLSVDPLENEKLITAEKTTVIKRWNKTGTLKEVKTTIEQPKGVVFPVIPQGFLSNDQIQDKTLITVEKTTVSYSYSNEGEIKSIITETVIPKGKLFSIYPGDTTLVTKIRQLQSCNKLPNGLYQKNTTVYEPLGIIQPETKPFSTTLAISKSETIISDEPPPAVEYPPASQKLTEEPIEVKVTIPAPSDNLPRRVDRFVPFVTSENQLAQWATNYLSLQHYRNNGWFVTIEYTELFLGDRIRIRDSEVIFDLVADAVTYQLTPDRLVVSFTGLTVAEEVLNPPSSTPGSTGPRFISFVPPPVIEILNKPIDVTIGILPFWIEVGDRTTVTVTVTLAKPATKDEIIGINFLGLLQYIDGAIPSDVTVTKGETTASFNFKIATITEPSPTILLYFVIGAISSRLKKGTPDTAILEIRNNLKPFVFITTNVPRIGEYYQQAVFTFRRQGDLTNPLVVDYTVSGTAPSSAYTPALGGSITIPANQEEIQVIIQSIPGTFTSPSVTLILTLQPNPNYVIKTATAIVTIVKTTAPTFYSSTLTIIGDGSATHYNPNMTIIGDGSISAGSSISYYNPNMTIIGDGSATHYNPNMTIIGDSSIS